MTSGFNPELGQLVFSNTPWQEHEVPELAIAAIHAIADEMERVMWNRNQEPYDAPTGNVGGGPFVTDVFIMRPYCWCDGDLHRGGCPPNFEWRDVRVCWYKHLGRSTSSNTHLTPDMISEMLTECLNSVRAMDVELP